MNPRQPDAEEGLDVTGSSEALATTLVVVALLVVGCSGGFGPTLPSPDGAPHNDTPTNDTPRNETPINDTPTTDMDGPVNTLCVRITDSRGRNACENVVLGASDGETLWTNEEVVDGAHCFTEVGTGQLGLVVGLSGFVTEYRQVSHPGGPQEVPVVMSTPIRIDPMDCPVVVRLEGVNQRTGTATVTGSATNTGAGSLLVFDNGEPKMVQFDDRAGPTPPGGGAAARTFTQAVVLREGQNHFSALVVNASCVVLSEQVGVVGEPIAF